MVPRMPRRSSVSRSAVFSSSTDMCPLGGVLSGGSGASAREGVQGSGTYCDRTAALVAWPLIFLRHDAALLREGPRG